MRFSLFVQRQKFARIIKRSPAGIISFKSALVNWARMIYGSDLVVESYWSYEIDYTLADKKPLIDTLTVTKAQDFSEHKRYVKNAKLDNPTRNPGGSLMFTYLDPVNSCTVIHINQTITDYFLQLRIYIFGCAVQHFVSKITYFFIFFKKQKNLENFRSIENWVLKKRNLYYFNYFKCTFFEETIKIFDFLIF